MPEPTRLPVHAVPAVDASDEAQVERRGRLMAVRLRFTEGSRTETMRAAYAVVDETTDLCKKDRLRALVKKLQLFTGSMASETQPHA